MKRMILLVTLIGLSTGLYADSLNVCLIGGIDTPGSARDIYVSGSYAYVTDYTNGLRIIDVSTPSALSEVGFYDTFGEAFGVYASGSYAYVADGDRGLRIIDNSTPSAPSEVGFYDTPGWARGVYVYDNYAYVASDYSGLRIIDVSTPSAPSEVGFYDSLGYAYDVYVSGSYAYVAAFSAGLRIIDISMPSAPTEVGFYYTGGYARGVYVFGTHAYVADYSSGLRIIDVSTPSAPSEVGFYDNGGSAFGVYVSDSYAYVANGSAGLYILDVSYFNSVDIAINRGWNLLSVPSEEPQPWTVFGDVPYGYNPATTDYYTADSLHPGKGYFVLSMDEDTVELSRGLETYSDTLFPGWNLIGALDHSISSHNFTTEPPDLGILPMFGWNGIDYFPASILEPGMGYWFLSSGHGRITVGP